jgi:hypothetical protein
MQTHRPSDRTTQIPTTARPAGRDKLRRLAKRSTVIAAGLAVCLGGTAVADTQSHANLSKDGSVWLVESSGHVCRIYTSQNLSSSTCLNANLVRVENHGYTSGVGGLVNARLYYNQSFQNGGRSAYACISPGDVWKHSPGGVTVHFDELDPAGASATGTGLNKAIWNDVARVKWTSAGCV